MKRLLSVILVIVMICSTFAGLQITSNADDLPSSGSCGTNITYTFDSSTGLLRIKGSGKMKYYSNGGSPFYNQENIKTVNIESGVTSIGGYAFFGCSGLTSITIPDSVTSIGGYAFDGCSSLTSITIPDSVTSIGDYAFYACRGLTSITMPDSVTSIGDYAFYACRGLTSITIPDSVNSIGYCAFSGCSGLTSITIPDSVTSIGYYAFSGCSGLTSITVDENNKVYDSRNNCNAIISTKTNTLHQGCKNTIIPNSVTSIGSTAFVLCSSLTSITIPDSVTSIGKNAFQGCKSLTSITIPNSVTSIGSYAFDGCSNLSSIDIKGENAVFMTTEYPYTAEYAIPKNTTIIINGSKNVYNYAKKYKRKFICNHVEEIDVAMEPTCTKSGLTQGSHCKACGTVILEQKETEAALGHDYIKTAGFAATCLTTGKEDTYTCSRCGDSYGGETIVAGHIYNNVIITTNPTCTSKGRQRYDCSRCDNSYYEDVAALGHDYIKTAGFAATCAKTGKADTYTCSRCGDSYGGETIAALGHSYNNAIVTTNPTCTAKGKQKYTCSRCDNSYYEDIAALGHNYQKTSTTYSTCTTRGKNTYTCSRCNNYYTEPLPLAEHSYKSANTIQKAAYKRNGKITKSKCSVCGAEGSTSIIYAPATIVLSTSTYTYSGKANKPAVTVKDSIGSVIDSSNYTVAYSNNINAGTAKVTVTFKGDTYEGSMSKTFKISPKKLTTCGLVTIYTYSGKAIVPVPYYYVTKKILTPDWWQTANVKTNYKKGTDYTIAVSGGHKNVGTYTVVIKFKGNYSGTVKKTMQIRPQPVKYAKAVSYSTTSIKASWKKIKGVTGYKIYRYNSTKDKYQLYKTTKSTSCIIARSSAKDTAVSFIIKTYTKVGNKIYYCENKNLYEGWMYTLPSKAGITLKNKDFGEFKIQFNRKAFHQVQISDNKAFSNKNGKFRKTFILELNNSVTISKSGSTNKYYVRAREYYYTSDSKLVVGKWSTVKTITTL